ncbi:MAG: alpha-glucan family phosphorylase [Gammaproteobacteria bacterium]|jgi:starch phosphorylase
MKRQSFLLEINPRIPDAIARLTELAENLWFSWHRPTRQLFNMLDRELWWAVGRNPILFLRCVDVHVLQMVAENETFLMAYRKALTDFDAYQDLGTTAYRPAGLGERDLVAYFCAEYGLHESFPMYSGGLGILAGDHCKTASDLRLPFVAVGILYKRGYFNQRIDRDGNQLADYPIIEPEDTPVRPVLDSAGEEIRISCRFPERDVSVRVWQIWVGRVPVLLLDTDVEENEPRDREITRALYGGTLERRLEQEFVLGVGGVRALRAAGYRPTVWHINEGHAALQVLERSRELIEQGVPFDAALEAVAANNVFTTHTPVAAGHDVFPREYVANYLRDMTEQLGISLEHLLSIAGNNNELNLTRLAISGARFVNGVSRIHARVSSDLCAGAWPEVPGEENPVGYITNGVHVPTFLRQEWADLLEDHLGPSWGHQFTDQSLMEGIGHIPDEQFWYVNQRIKSSMLVALRDRLERQYARNEVSQAHIRRLLRYVDPGNPNVLTIVFARRFATYKRATLLLNNLEWLREILGNPERPVVVIFAGKAHPADEPGQAMLRDIHRVGTSADFAGNILLVEGYDIGLGRLLTAGADIWLNVPTHPLEASGTSGMKAAINGTVNLSVLDGWWAEGFDGTNGWAIPPSSDLDGDAIRDQHDAATLYEILQDDVIPKYYARADNQAYSEEWVAMCKRSMASVMPRFNSRRVVHDYAVELYGPAARQGQKISDDDCRGARDLAEWKRRVRELWPNVTLSLVARLPRRVEYGSEMLLEVDVRLAGLAPEEVRVECVMHRELCSEMAVPVPRFCDIRREADGVQYLDGEAVMVVPFVPSAESSGEVHRYSARLDPAWCGRLSYELRAVPTHPLLSHPYEVGLMHWA